MTTQTSETRGRKAVMLIAPEYLEDVKSLPDITANARQDRKESVLKQCAANIGAYYGADVAYNYKNGLFVSADSRTAYIPVTGTLVNRLDWSEEWVTGYAAISRMIDAAIEDPAVEQVIWDFNTGGGEAAGNFELADKIFSYRGRKPMVAVVNSAALSGGYSLAAAVGSILVSKTSSVGSIGVVSAVVNVGKMYEKMGVSVEYFYAGDRKIDGNPFKPLTDEARTAINERVVALYDIFTDSVSRYRNMSKEAVTATQAGIFLPDQAIALGLADAIFNDVKELPALFGNSKSTTTLESTHMTNPQTAPVAGAEQPQIKQESVDAAAASAAAGQKERIKTILAAGNGGREEMANHLAFNTELSAEVAIGIINASPKKEAPSAAAPSTNPFEAAMAATQQPSIGEAASAENTGSTDVVSTLLADFTALTGYAVKK